jgi:hypothetical protein
VSTSHAHIIDRSSTASIMMTAQPTTFPPCAATVDNLIASLDVSQTYK